MLPVFGNDQGMLRWEFIESIKNSILYWNNRYWDPDEETSAYVACFPRLIRGDAKNTMCSVWLQKQNAQNIHMMGMNFTRNLLTCFACSVSFVVVLFGLLRLSISEQNSIPRIVRIALNEMPIQRRGRNRKKSQKIICESLPSTSLHIKWAQSVFFSYSFQNQFLYHCSYFNDWKVILFF